MALWGVLRVLRVWRGGTGSVPRGGSSQGQIGYIIIKKEYIFIWYANGIWTIYWWLTENEGFLHSHCQDSGCDVTEASVCFLTCSQDAAFPGKHGLQNSLWIFLRILLNSHRQKKNSPNEKAESAFISTATLIDILKVEQLLSVLTTAGWERGRGNGARPWKGCENRRGSVQMWLGCLLQLDPSTHAWNAFRASGLNLLCGAAGQDQTSCQRGHHLHAIMLFIPSSLKLSRRFCSADIWLAIIFSSIFYTGGSGGGFWRNLASNGPTRMTTCYTSTFFCSFWSSTVGHKITRFQGHVC